MPRVRWFVFAFLLVAALAGGILNERGPFDAHPTLSYEQFLGDFAAGRIPRIVQWRDQLEVNRNGQLMTVVVPDGRDLATDLAQARHLGAWSFSGIPDSWLGLYTPAAAIVILIAASLIWATALIRNGWAYARARPWKAVES